MQNNYGTIFDMKMRNNKWLNCCRELISEQLFIIFVTLNKGKIYDGKLFGKIAQRAAL
jgi:type IV secretory pathway protease TraF